MKYALKYRRIDWYNEKFIDIAYRSESVISKIVAFD